MAYVKFAGPVPRILILESGYWLDGACANAARGMGWSVRTTPVTLEGGLPREAVAMLLQSIVEFRPDFILNVNLSGMDVDGLLARLFEDIQLPSVAWFVDDPRTIIMDQPCFATPWSVALTWERAYKEYLLGVGFPLVAHLPLAVDPTLFDQPPATEWAFPPTFVGNSMTGPAEYEWGWVSGHPDVADAVRDAFAADRVTRASFARGLDALLSEKAASGFDPDERRHAEILCFVEGTRRLRRTLAERLEPEGLEVRGDEHWSAFFPRAHGPVNYIHELPSFYRACEVNLNVTSIQMAGTVNQRVFDCPAAGGFLLTDAQSDLAELFEIDREVTCCHNFDDCAEKVRWFRAHPAARTEITRRAQTRITNEHTYAHRLRALARVLQDRFRGN
jgi:spore maturation protein CgeB